MRKKFLRSDKDKIQKALDKQKLFDRIFHEESKEFAYLYPQENWATSFIVA